MVGLSGMKFEETVKKWYPVLLLTENRPTWTIMTLVHSHTSVSNILEKNEMTRFNGT